MCSNRVDIHNLWVVLFFNFHFLDLLFTFPLFLLGFHLFLHNFNNILLRLLLLVFIDCNNLFNSPLHLHRVITQGLGYIGQVNECISTYPSPNQRLTVSLLLLFLLIASDNGKDLVCNRLQDLRRLILDQLVDHPQVVFVDEFVLLGLGPVVETFVKFLVKDVSAFEGRLADGCGLFLGFLGLVPGNALAHG